MKRLISKVISAMLIFSGAILVLSLYAATAERHGILPQQQHPDELFLLFTVLLSIPALIICFWSGVVHREILLPPVRIGDVFWRIEITRWRAGFAAALLGLLILEFLA